MPTVRSRRCLVCDAPYDVTAFEEKGKPTVFLGLSGQPEGPEGPKAICPECESSEYKPIITGGKSYDLQGYPYFDMGANRMFENARERRDWMKANGLAPLDGELANHLDGIARAQDAAARHHQGVVDRMHRAAESDPDYWNATDKKLMPKLGVQEVPRK